MIIYHMNLYIMYIVLCTTIPHRRSFQLDANAPNAGLFVLFVAFGLFMTPKQIICQSWHQIIYIRGEYFFTTVNISILWYGTFMRLLDSQLLLFILITVKHINCDNKISKHSVYCFFWWYSVGQRPFFCISWLPLEMIRFWSRFVDLPNFGANLGVLVILWKTHKRNVLTFGLLMYRGSLQNWFDFGHALLILIILAQFWINETGFLGFPGILWRIHGRNGLKEGAEAYFRPFASNSV